MPGLMTNPMPSASPPPGPPAPPAPGGATPGTQPGKPGGPPIGQGPVDPELEKKMIANCMNVVTGGLTQIVKTVQQSNDKVAALAQSAVFVVIRVEDSLEQSGGQLNLNMTFDAGAETITDIVDAVKKSGVYDYSQQEIQAAFLRAVNQYRTVRQQQGRLDPAMFQQILAQMKQQQANGTLDQSFPGLSDFANKAKTAAKPSYQPQQDQGDDDQQEDQGQDDGSADGDQDQGGAPPAAAPAAPAPVAAPVKKKKAEPPIPEPGQNFPEAMLKKGHHTVKQHIRRNPGNKPKTKNKKGGY